MACNTENIFLVDSTRQYQDIGPQRNKRDACAIIDNPIDFYQDNAETGSKKTYPCSGTCIWSIPGTIILFTTLLLDKFLVPGFQNGNQVLSTETFLK